MCFGKMLYFITFVSLLNYVAYGQFTITTNAGVVSGTAEEGTINGATYKAFINIPYAMAPVDALRFKAPVPYSAVGTGNINSKKGAVLCPQMLGPAVGGDEDCLILNVFTPMDAKDTNLYPVMVWIHGGAFSSGSSSTYQPEFLVAEGIVLVTINYRLGALGFLSLGDEDAPGNAALKDQALALTWVKNEISKFGGDATQTTIFGESAGAASVHHHILSSYSSGLFQQAIMQSGSAISQWAFMETGFLEQAKILAESLGCIDHNTIVFQCLQNASVKNIVIYQNNIPVDIETEIQAKGLPFVPIKEVVTKGAFHSASLKHLIKTVANPVPVIMGTNKDEGLCAIRQSNIFFRNFFSNLKYFIPEEVRVTLSKTEIESRTDKLKKYYFSQLIPPTIYNYQAFVNLYTDFIFAVPTLKSAFSLLDQAINSTVYLYTFEYNGDFRIILSDAWKLGISGVDHGDDLGYLFRLSWTEQNSTSEACKVLNMMVKMWTSFATTGSPIPPTLDTNSDLYGITWKPISPANLAYLAITAVPKMVSNYTGNSIELWKELSEAKTSKSWNIKPTVLISLISFTATKLFVMIYN